MNVDFSMLRAKVALILSIEFEARNCIDDLFNPDLICTKPEDLQKRVRSGDGRIKWFAESGGGDIVFCEGMSLEEFCVQYQRNNCLFTPEPALSRFGLPAWIIKRRFKVIDGGK
jgi:hypothetical protein